MSRKLVVTFCLGLAPIAVAAVGAAATEYDAAYLRDITPAVAGQVGWFGHTESGTDITADPGWLVRFAAEPDADQGFARPGGGGFAAHRAFDLGGLEGGAAAGFNFGLDADGFAEPVHRGDWAQTSGLPGDAFIASLGGAVGFRFGDIQAGPFSRLAYHRSVVGGGAAIGTQPAIDQSLTGSVGLQASTRFDGGLGPMESTLRLSLDQDLMFDRQGVGSTLDPWRRNIYVEEVDASRFDFSNAIVFLKHRGRIPGWFFYETRIRVRMTGLKSISGRIWIKW